MRAPTIIMPSPPDLEDVKEGGRMLGILLYDLLLSREYSKWKEKQLTAREKGKVEKIGKTEYFFDEETGRWYPMVDLPPSATLPEKELFLRKLRMSGVSDIEGLKKEVGFQEEYMSKVQKLGDLMIKKTFDLGTLQKVQMLLAMAQGMPLEQRNRVLDSLIEMLEGYEGIYQETRKDEKTGVSVSIKRKIEEKTKPKKRIAVKEPVIITAGKEEIPEKREDLLGELVKEGIPKVEEDIKGRYIFTPQIIRKFKE